MKSWKKPTAEQVDRAVALLGRAEQYRYFFDQLQNPEWLQPLKEKGFFEHPPAPVENDVDGSTRFPIWPETRYLARIAPHKPELVRDCLLDIPETANFRVHEDLLDAMLSVPVTVAVTLAPKAKAWLESPYLSSVPDKVAALIRHLLHGGQTVMALELAQELYRPLTDPRHVPGAEREVAQFLPTELRTRFFDVSLYRRSLEKLAPEMSAAGGMSTLELLCDLLEDAVCMSLRTGARANDRSHIWRPKIDEESDLNWHKVKNALASATHDVAMQLLETGTISLEELVAVFSARDLLIFRRLILHFVRLFGHDTPDLLWDNLSDTAQLEEPGLQREYALLLTEKFEQLDAERRAVILQWIEQGPDLSQLAATYELLHGHPPSDMELQEYAERWRRDRLALIVTTLPDGLQEQYRELVERTGEPRSFISPAIGPAEVTRVGGTSPKTNEELRSLTADELLGYLQEWQPPSEHFGPTIEGLAQELIPVVSSQPGDFAARAEKLRSVHPTYIWAFLMGFRAAIEREAQVDWPPLLDLCVWLVSQSAEPAGDEGALFETGLGKLRPAVLDLLSAGLQTQAAGQIPFEHREDVWALLTVLTHDPDPTPGYEARYGGTNLDPATLSINTTRGKAMHTVLHYALWTRRHLKANNTQLESENYWFNHIPEVQVVLEQHLDPNNDPSLAIRAVYGQWFPWLVSLDSKWAEQKVPVIFPAEEALRELRDAAWHAYLFFNRVYDDTAVLLQSEYERAVSRISRESQANRQEMPWSMNTEERLGRHLMILYWRGQLPLEASGSLVLQFFERADVQVRASALRFIGISLHNTEDEIPQEIIERLTSLWQMRFEAAGGASDPKLHSAELAAFGWWFTSGKFDDSWALSQLRNVLSVGGKIENIARVVDRLVALAPTLPLQAVECLSHLVRGEEGPMVIYGWADKARHILESAIRSEDVEAARAGRQVAEELGRLGFAPFFRDLVS